MSDTFESLWLECSEPSDRDDGERRDLADLSAAERERIRLELLAEAEATPPALYDPLAERLHDFGLLEGGDRLEATTLIRERLAAALRDFARRLEPKP